MPACFSRVAGLTGLVLIGLVHPAIAGPLPPPNASCASAIDVSAGGEFVGSLDGGLSGPPSSCLPTHSVRREVWYTFTAPTAGRLTVTTCGTFSFEQVDAYLTVFTDCPNLGGVELACNDEMTAAQVAEFCNGSTHPGSTHDSVVRPVLAAGQTVKIRATHNSLTSSFVGHRLRVSFGIQNDRCADAIDVGTGGVFAGTLEAATPDGDAYCPNATGAPDAWYQFIAPSNGTLSVSTCGTNDASGMDTVLSVYAAGGACAGAGLACNDDWHTGGLPPTACQGLDVSPMRDSATSVPVAAGQMYKIRVSRYNTTTVVGPFTLRATFKIHNDDCEDAQSVLLGNYNGTLVGASIDGSASCVTPAAADVWYRLGSFALPGIAWVRTCGTNDLAGQDTGIDTVLSLHASCGGPALVCNDDWTSSAQPVACVATDLGFARDSSVAVARNAGEPTLIRVSRFSTSSSGPFRLLVDYDPLGACCRGAQCAVETFSACSSGGVFRNVAACTPSLCCRADINDTGTLSVQDIFDFLSLYFTNDPRADFNLAGGVTVQDIFDFLAAYFTGCH